MPLLLSIILKGLLIGFLAAAPTGPSGILVIESTLNRGRRHGLLTGLGVSTSDAIYIVCSSIGISFIMDFVSNPETSFLCSIVGSVLLFVFGLFTIRNNPLAKRRSPGQDSHSARAYLSGFMVAVVNPTVVFIYISLFAYFCLALSELTGLVKVAGYLSVFAGDVLWWLFITRFINRLRNRFDLKGIWVINRILGSILMAAALIWLVVSLVKGR